MGFSMIASQKTSKDCLAFPALVTLAFKFSSEILFNSAQFLPRYLKPSDCWDC